MSNLNSTNKFAGIIKEYLEKRAVEDPLFAETLKKENKSIDGCVTYILNTVKSSGKNGFADDEIFGMAVHYYDEDDIKIGKPISGRVVVNKAPELTPAEIEAAKKQAYDSLVKQEQDRLKSKGSKKAQASKPESVQPQSLFEL